MNDIPVNSSLGVMLEDEIKHCDEEMVKAIIDMKTAEIRHDAWRDRRFMLSEMYKLYISENEKQGG